MDQTTQSCRDFTEVLASSSPAPGGGGAAALAGALGAALTHMVGALTVGKAKYAPVEEELRTLMARCQALRTQLLDQVEADEEGFLPLARAYHIPKDDPTRAAALEAASLAACAAPMQVMELCGEALDIAAIMAEKGSPLAVSDAGCAAALLKGAMEAASLNVFINTKGMADRQQASELNIRCLTMLDRYGQRAQHIFRQVRDSLLP